MASKVKHRQPKKLSIPEILEVAERSELTGDPKHAIKLISIGIQRTDRHDMTDSNQHDKEETMELLLELLERRADLYVTLQNPDLASQDYQRSLDLLEQEESSTKNNELLQRKAAIHMYMGQLSTGMEALTAYQKGIDCLQAQQQQASDDDDHMQQDQEESVQQQQQLAAAYTSMAELFLTDLCFEENAEASCQQYLEFALQRDEKSVDALQTLASLQLSQQKSDEAKETIRQVYNQLQAGCRALASLVGLRDDDDNQVGATELMALDSVQALPMFEFRCQTAKLLLETNQPAMAIDVIGSLLAENDQVIEIWILAGDAFAALDQQQDNDDEMNTDGEPLPHVHYWERAVEMLTVVKGNLEQELQDDGNNDQEDDDLQQQLDQVEAQLDDVRTKLEEADVGAER